MEILAVLIAMGVSWSVGAGGWGLGRRIGILDRPDDTAELKIHSSDAVPLGGVGILMGLHAGLAVVGSFDIGLLLASLLIWALGFLDDIRGLGPWIRLLGATASGVLLVVYGDMPSGLVAGTAAVLVVVVAVNAVNLLDGLDALAGSVAASALIGLAILGKVSLGIDSAGILIAAAAVVGFLLWNLPPARLFLGNNGAYLVGLILSWAALQQQHDWWAGALAVAAIGVPFMDMGITIVRRLRSGADLFGGDRDHTYDRLHQQGWSSGKIAILFSTVQVLWVGLVLAAASAFGDLTATILAASLGLVLVLVLGLRERHPVEL